MRVTTASSIDPSIGLQAPGTGLKQLIQVAQSKQLALACDHFYFLRHGQTPRNASRIFQGPEEPLSDLGTVQAKDAAGLLLRHSLTTVICSDMVRARQTAMIVAAAHNLTPVDHPGLRERNFGVLIGTSSHNIDWACAPDQGETLPAFVTRTCVALAEALARPAPTLVVAHGGTLYVLAASLGIEVDLSLLGNAHPLRFERQGSRWVVTPLAGAIDLSNASTNLA